MIETIKRVIVLLGNVLNLIGKIPAFLLPAKLKGFRTELFNGLAALVVILEGFEITSIADAICGLFNCDPKLIVEVFMLLVTSVNVSLRRKTDTAPHKN